MCLKIDVKVLEKSWHTSIGSWHDFGCISGRLSLEKSLHDAKATWHEGNMAWSRSNVERCRRI